MDDDNRVFGQVIKAVGGLYTVSTKNGMYTGKPRGIFRKNGTQIIVGDYVDISIDNEEENSCILETLHERKTSLIRPKVANVTQSILVFSLQQPTINFDLLDRFIILSEYANLKVVLCLNKCDLITEEEYEEFYNIYGSMYDVVKVSTKTSEGIKDLKTYLKGEVSVFAGASGVGKSSIVNNLFDKTVMETGEISDKISRGKHTTRHSEFILLDTDDLDDKSSDNKNASDKKDNVDGESSFNNGLSSTDLADKSSFDNDLSRSSEVGKNTSDKVLSYVVDTPGFTSLSTKHIDKQHLKDYYREFKPYEEDCKFLNCVHINEPKCGVKDNVGINISPKRYKSYKYYYEE